MDNASQIVACAEESVVVANAPTPIATRSIEHEDGYWMTILLHRRRREKLYASIYRNFPAKGFVVVRLGHHTPARAVRPHSLTSQTQLERLGCTSSIKPTRRSCKAVMASPL